MESKERYRQRAMNWLKFHGTQLACWFWTIYNQKKICDYALEIKILVCLYLCLDTQSCNTKEGKERKGEGLNHDLLGKQRC